MTGLGLGLQDYMMGAYNPYMMGAYNMINPGAYMNYKNEDDMKAHLNALVDDRQSGLYASGQGRISQKTYALANQLRGALQEKDSSLAGSLLNQVKGDEYQLAGLEQAYDAMSGSRTALRQDIRKGMEGNRLFSHFGLGGVDSVIFGAKKAVLNMFGLEPMTEKEAIGILNFGSKASTTVAANALKDATNGPADDETINYVLGNAGSRMGEIEASYNQMGNLGHDINKSHYFFVDGFEKPERLNKQINSLRFSA